MFDFALGGNFFIFYYNVGSNFASMRATLLLAHASDMMHDHETSVALAHACAHVQLATDLAAKYF